MSEPLLAVDRVSKSFGGFDALSQVSLTVRSGERLGIIGPNGSGKTTLINCICGSFYSDAGSIAFDGIEVTRIAAHRRARLGIARSFQVPRPFSSMTLAENVAVQKRGPSWRGWAWQTGPMRRPARSPRWICASSNWLARWRRTRACLSSTK